MKCFQICVLIFTVSVSSRNIETAQVNCELERRGLGEEFTSCGPNGFDLLDYISLVKQFVNHTIGNTEFSNSITRYCVNLNAATNCSLGKVANVNAACHHTPAMEHIVNFMVILARMGKDFCSEQVFLNIANDNGIKCFFDEHKETSCTQEPLVVPYSEYAFDDKNVCANLNHQRLCSVQFFEECQHDGQILNYTNQAWNNLNEEFSCNP